MNKFKINLKEISNIIQKGEENNIQNILLKHFESFLNWLKNSKTIFEKRRGLKF